MSGKKKAGGSKRSKLLQQARAAQKNEFYTQLSDIEAEMDHYQKHFRGKVVYCNCDDPTVSKFFHYFAMKFGALGLQELVTTCYKNNQRDIFSKEESEISVGLKYKMGGAAAWNGDPHAKELSKFQFSLKGDGDFRSDECIEYLKKANIVVTNPPFSLFREYLAQLIEHKKKFIILGNLNAISTKHIFPLFQNNQVWFGPSISSGDRWFGVPSHYPFTTKLHKIENGHKFVKVSGVRWFTNIDHKRRHKELILCKSYNKQDYPKYDNFDAINVNKTAEIPKDYPHAMGVPITFIDKYNPDQFEIIGITDKDHTELRTKWYSPEFLRKHKKKGLNGRGVLRLPNGDYELKYARILIRNRNPEKPTKTKIREC